MKNAHEEIIMSGDETNKRSQCDKLFSFKPSLSNHMRTCHGEKSYSCSDCKKPFNSPLLLQKHAGVHNGENPGNCFLCKKPFSQNHLLLRHLEIHNGENPYCCDQCPKMVLKASSPAAAFGCSLWEKGKTSIQLFTMSKSLFFCIQS